MKWISDVRIVVEGLGYIGRVKKYSNHIIKIINIVPEK